jgi:hypothetical protein
METKSHCKELEELLKKLKKGKIIHETNKGNHFKFVEYRNHRLYFSIPCHKAPFKPYKKSITDEQFCKLIKKLLKKILITENFPFHDCRKSAFYGFAKIYLNQR